MFISLSECDQTGQMPGQHRRTRSGDADPGEVADAIDGPAAHAVLLVIRGDTTHARRIGAIKPIECYKERNSRWLLVGG